MRNSVVGVGSGDGGSSNRTSSRSGDKDDDCVDKTGSNGVVVVDDDVNYTNDVELHATYSL
jgi:hypothetical protein